MTEMRGAELTFRMTGLEAVRMLLDGEGFGYWLDSGSLLGFIRDGAELPWDSDIDLGVWENEIPAVVKALEAFRRKGYSVSDRRYRGRTYGFTIEDRRGNAFRPVHIHVYFRAGDIAWSPQTVSYAPVARERATEGFARGNLVRRLLTYLKHNAQQRRSGSPGLRLWRSGLCFPLWGALALLRGQLDREHWAGLWPYSTIYAMYTWVIPAKHFTELEYKSLGDGKIPIPGAAEEYLTRRYGDWRTPVSDWCYWTDDGCIRPAPPEHVVGDGR